MGCVAVVVVVLADRMDGVGLAFCDVVVE